MSNTCSTTGDISSSNMSSFNGLFFAISGWVSAVPIGLLVMLILGIIFRVRGKIYSGIKMDLLTKEIQNKRIYSSLTSNDDKDFGLFIGICVKPFHLFAGWIYDKPVGQNEVRTAIVISTTATHNWIVKDADDLNECETKKQINLFYKGHSHIGWPDWTSRKMPKLIVSPTIQQQTIIDTIMKIYAVSKRCVAFVHGGSGSGKTLLGSLIAKVFLERKEIKKVSFCSELHPTKAGEEFEEFYTKAGTSAENPLVLVFNETDGILKEIVKGKVGQHLHARTMLMTKNDWNSFLDKFSANLCFYPYTIFLMTSNKAPNECVVDGAKSMLNDKRIDKVFNLEITDDMLNVQNKLKALFE